MDAGPFAVPKAQGPGESAWHPVPSRPVRGAFGPTNRPAVAPAALDPPSPTPAGASRAGGRGRCVHPPVPPPAGRPSPPLEATGWGAGGGDPGPPVPEDSGPAKAPDGRPRPVPGARDGVGPPPSPRGTGLRAEARRADPWVTPVLPTADPPWDSRGRPGGGRCTPTPSVASFRDREGSLGTLLGPRGTPRGAFGGARARDASVPGGAFGGRAGAGASPSVVPSTFEISSCRPPRTGGVGQLAPPLPRSSDGAGEATLGTPEAFGNPWGEEGGRPGAFRGSEARPRPRPRARTLGASPGCMAGEPHGTAPSAPMRRCWGRDG